MRYIIVIIITFMCLLGTAFAFDQLTPFDKHWEDKFKFQSTVFDSATTIACPKCGHAIHANYSIALTSNPIKYEAWCPNCDWKGYI